MYYSYSKANKIDDKAYKYFKGDKSKLILKQSMRNFTTKVIGTHDRDVDSEYKLFEYASLLVNDGAFHELNLLSELSSCESCLKVMEQFNDRFKNVEISMVSTKESRMKKLNDRSKEAFINRWKKK